MMGQDQDCGQEQRFVPNDHDAASEALKEKGRTSRLCRSWPMIVIVASVIGGLIMWVGGLAAVVSIFAAPPPTARPTGSITPIPMSVSLPGGWVFPLEPDPLGPRDYSWVWEPDACSTLSFPWTLQLETVLRTFKVDDVIKIGMSNYSELAYKVRSVEQVTSSEIAQRAKDNAPCLLITLSKEGTDTLWLLTAKP